ncbi:hypothetical protein BH23PAT1_BH23PAT1_4120 [soil metagenome]
MEPNELKPQEPQQENQTITPETQPPTSETKKFPNKLVLIGVAAVVIVMAGGLVLSKTVFKQSSRGTNTNNLTQAENLSVESKAVEQVFVSPVDGKKTDIKEVQYYSVTVGSTDYYGRVSKINNDYIRMLPTAYKKGSVLTFTGKELHGPEAATYYHISKVTKFQELTDTAVIEAVKAADATVSDAFPSSNINKYVKSGQFQAYYFTDGSAFFAKTTSLDGNFLASSSHVYVLRSEGTNSPQVSLVLAKPEQYKTRISTDLAYWQNMKSDSQIAKAATQFEENQ